MLVNTTRHQEQWEKLEAFRLSSAKLEDEKRKNDAISLAVENIPPRFKGKRFTDFLVESTQQNQVKKIVERYENTFIQRLSEGSSLVFMGKPGTGKTFLARILEQALIHQGLLVKYQPSLAFLKDLHDKQFLSYDALNAELKFYQRLQFLIIDEVTEGCGKGAYPADWERNLLRMIIDVRYQYCLPTLVITNRNKPELIERLGEPTMDRLCEKGIFLAFNWESFRQKAI